MVSEKFSYGRIHRDFISHFCSLAYGLTIKDIAVYTIWVQKLIYSVFTSFSSLQSVTKKIAAIENYKITRWKNINELLHSFVNFGSFSKRISPKLFNKLGSNFHRQLKLFCSFNIPNFHVVSFIR